ncbi:survival protein sure-like phosphatase/nucleotidase [Podospora aff. communis PSN243]|uniref:Survival protein sure-like phosphatase/nucleotidase n=1 Tax=Podospora aff. communis PSN243 TaxID=3040156 RepID=A0AAV9GPY6_9PEZI|nr:survival protein sure-like phosphatase/nucleotidase [Podospora aff. communis PSN243]
MWFSSSFACVAVALSLLRSCNAINILMSNDDGFASANLRQLFNILTGAGHNVYVVAPVIGQSGQGGRVIFTSEANLTGPSQYGLIPTGAPSIGSDPAHDHIFYYNGTPAACIFVALDYVLPTFADFAVPDLVLSGPNYGTNLGPSIWSLSGTAGAAYTATARSIPAIALSGSNTDLPYFAVDGPEHDAHRVALASFRVVQAIIQSTPRGQPIFPLGYGANVNIPPLSSNQTSLPIVQTRMTGGAEVDVAVPGKTPGTFTWANMSPRARGLNKCINGDCNLPGETQVVAAGKIALSLYTIDYTAPAGSKTASLMQRIAVRFSDLMARR